MRATKRYSGSIGINVIDYENVDIVADAAEALRVRANISRSTRSTSATSHMLRDSVREVKFAS